MAKPVGLEPVATFCGNCNCGCPQLFWTRRRRVSARVVITDDFGQRVEMSADQFSSLVEDAKAGRPDSAALA
jgi:hypothetical protein